MTRKYVILPIIALTIIAAWLLPAFSADKKPVLQDPTFAPRQRPAPLFDHEKHTNYDQVKCGVCHHHADKNGKRVDDENQDAVKCAQCHKPAPADKTTRLLRAYHQACKSCHEKVKKGPIACGECHVK